MQGTISPIKFEKLVEGTVEALPKRTKVVIVRRFGLKNGKKDTLDAIGKDYGITRERVRQVENDGLGQLKRPAVLSRLAPAVEYLQDHFAAHGHVRAEERILGHLSGEEHPHPGRQAIFFVLMLADPFLRETENDQYHAHWVTREEGRERAYALLQRLAEKFSQQPHQTLSHDDVLSSAREYASLEDAVAQSYLEISKHIKSNVFGEYGLAEWPEVSPRGVRDRAYLVVHRNKKPLHFSEIADLINEAKFTDRRAYVQTVHNELIKDKRFVLVGRGLYALSEWGYAPGTVREVLKQVLQDRGPLTKDEVLAETLKRRVVRPNTILLNLQTSDAFTKLEDGRYALAA